MKRFVESEKRVQISEEDEFGPGQRGIEIFEGAEFDGAAQMMRGRRNGDGSARRRGLDGRQ